MGLRPDEAQGRFFLNLDIGLPVGRLRDPLRATLDGTVPDAVELGGHNRRGQPIRCRITFARLRSHDEE
ncbi:MAG TPA: hypothetical protein VFA66_03120 [Gaiellaceae bacterium]|nr:hypothetical protein [Gaiellaceae bacterium]